jgi:CheY-like chemotaxis protein
MSLAQAIGKELPGLRRFARALCGTQRSGDAYVTEALEAILADPTLVREADAKTSIYRLLLTLWDAVDINHAPSPPEDLAALSSPEHSLQAISPKARAAFLLTALEGFSANTAAKAMLTTPERIAHLLDSAQREIAEQTAGKVLIIEDEPVIAMEVAGVAEGMGHTVLAVARTHAEAVTAAHKHNPDLILADIRLADDSSGIEAVQEILRSIDVPVIFITAFPERLLTGERSEPTYLLEKPFGSSALKAMISQVMFFKKPPASNTSASRPETHSHHHSPREPGT